MPNRNAALPTRSAVAALSLTLSLALAASLARPADAATAAHSNTQESSTIDGANTDTFIPAANLASGVEHLVIYNAGYGGASDADEVGARIEYGTSVLGRSADEGSSSGTPESIRVHQLAGFFVITGNGTDELRLRHQVVTGTSFVGGKGIISVPLAGLVPGSDYFVSQHNADSDESATASTSYVDVRSVTFDLPDAGGYLVLASMEATMPAGAPEGGAAIRLQIGGTTQKMPWAKEWETNSQSQNFAYARIHPLNAGDNTFVLQGATSQGSSTAGFRRSRIIVVRAASFDQMTSAETDAQSSTAQTFETSGAELGWDDWLTHTYTPNQPESVLVIGNGFAWPGQSFRSTAARLENTTDATIFSDANADDANDARVDRSTLLVTGFEQINAAKTYALQLSNEDNTVQAGLRQYGDLIVWGMTLAAFCGDGAVTAGEQCDSGASNGTPGQCCSETCTLEPVTTECRGAAGICDAAERCTGVDPTCPADAFEAGSTECRAAAGLCDVAESCTGASAACPADALLPAATACRTSGGACDVAETCDGLAPTCPTDLLVPDATECRAAAGFCDLAEACNGIDAVCPADSFKPSKIGCRGPQASCDVQENCTGVDALCPADGYEPATTLCRAAESGCDMDEFCTGVGIFCPADQTLNVGDACAAGDACTIGQLCLAGLVCGGGEPLACDDGNICTADSCDSVTGCAHAPIPNCAAGVPTTSSWGVALLGLFLTIAGAALLERRGLQRGR